MVLKLLRVQNMQQAFSKKPYRFHVIYMEFSLVIILNIPSMSEKV